MSSASSSMAVLSSFARFAGMSYCLLQAFDTVKCVGPSMLPTLNRNGDIVLLDKLSPHYYKIRKGEVVIAKSMTNPKQTVCKRVIAEEGDTVAVRSMHSHISYHQIPKGYVWLEGDNKHDSHDSRSYGPVPYAMIQGRVFMRIWPLNQIGYVKAE